MMNLDVCENGINPSNGYLNRENDESLMDLEVHFFRQTHIDSIDISETLGDVLWRNWR